MLFTFSNLVFGIVIYFIVIIFALFYYANKWNKKEPER